MNNDFSIRFAKQSDAAELLHIYTPFVLQTYFTPESKVPSLLEFKERIRQLTEFYPYLVCSYDKKIIGFAHAGQYRHASGHQWSVETSVYVIPGFQGKGVAHSLYDNLLSILKIQNFVNVFAGIILPNDRSVAFHRKFYFTDVGIFKKGIYKLGEWYDVKWMQRALKDHTVSPLLPLSIQSILNTKSLREIRGRSNYPFNK